MRRAGVLSILIPAVESRGPLLSFRLITHVGIMSADEGLLEGRKGTDRRWRHGPAMRVRIHFWFWMPIQGARPWSI